MFSDLLRYRKEQKYVCFDFETEGLNKLHSRPFQCSFITFDLNNVYESYNNYILWDDINVSIGAARQTRFDYTKYKNSALDAKEALEAFSSYINNPEYLIVGHNILGYDFLIYNVWRQAFGLPVDYSFLQRVVDSHLIAKAIKKQIPPDRKNFLQWQFKLCNLIEKGLKTNLEKLGKEYKIEYNYDTLHDGMNDVILNHQVFLKQIWEIEI